MATESPLFQSALELLGHSVTHFNGTSELDRKLVILHLSNAVELILKDIVLESGESIYKNPKETISIHGCIDVLKNQKCAIPFLNKIELLIDERNALQHRFGSPNELTTIFYMHVVQEFFKEILKQFYGLDYYETLGQYAEEKDLVALKIREPTNDSELENLKKLADIHPLGAFLAVIAFMDRTLLNFDIKLRSGCEGLRPNQFSSVSSRVLRNVGVQISEELGAELDEIRMLRNKAVHGRLEPQKIDVVKAINIAEKFENFLSDIDVEKAREAALEFRNRRTGAYIKIRTFMDDGADDN